MKKNLRVVVTLMVSGSSLSSLSAAADDFSMQIKDTMRLSGQGVIMTGKIAEGQLSNGDSLCVPLSKGGEASREVKGMEKMAKVVSSASAGEHVGILVGDLKEDDIAVGEFLTSGCEG